MTEQNPTDEQRVVPSTPAAVARAVLDAIEASPGSFDMDRWVSVDGGRPLPGYRLAPGADLCRSTMCVAGWAAHVTGWTIVAVDEPVQMTFVDRTDWTVLYVEKAHERRRLWDVARAALGLTEAETFWDVEPEIAISRLQAIATD